jgi:hypothetical protein
MHYLTAYPETAAARDRFIIDLRGPRPQHDPWRYQDLVIDDEPTERGDVARVGTILTGCEALALRHALALHDTPRHASRRDPAQIEAAGDVARTR